MRITFISPAGTLSGGCRVIAIFVAGIPEFVVDGESGWLGPAGDVDALAQAMEACLGATPERLGAMGRNGRARTLARHDIDAAAAQLEALFMAPLSLTA